MNAYIEEKVLLLVIIYRHYPSKKNKNHSATTFSLHVYFTLKKNKFHKISLISNFIML